MMTREQAMELMNRFNVKFIFNEEYDRVEVLFPNIRELVEKHDSYHELLHLDKLDIPYVLTIPSRIQLEGGFHDATDEELGNPDLF